MVGGSLDNVNMLQSSESPLNASLNQNLNNNPPNSQGGHHGV